jgi:hypothetical protein
MAPGLPYPVAMPHNDDKDSGKLKIGDHWNAITIIALSQNNPLKAIAEFVENSIDAGAKNVTIVRGKHRNDQYLKIVDDGSGILPVNPQHWAKATATSADLQRRTEARAPSPAMMLVSVNTFPNRSTSLTPRKVSSILPAHCTSS